MAKYDSSAEYKRDFHSALLGKSDPDFYQLGHQTSE